MSNRRYEYHTKALICILNESPAESSGVLLEVRHRLLSLMSERENYEITSGMVSDGELFPLHSPSRIPSAKEVDIYHKFVQLARDNFEQTLSSPKLVIYGDSSDDDSY